MIASFNLREQGRDVATSVREGAMTRLASGVDDRARRRFRFCADGHSPAARAREVQRPPATVVIGGILSSTFLTLVLLPDLCRWMNADKTNNLKSQNH